MPMRILCIGDAMIPGDRFKQACRHFSVQDNIVTADDWEDNWDRLQNRRLVIEKYGPDAEPVLPMIRYADKNTEVLLVLYAPVSKAAMEALPNLRLIGTARAGTENVDIQAATERGILVHHIMGRNAHAVSDFTIGILIAEARNIGRAHMAIKQGFWRKSFMNSDDIQEIGEKTLGIVGFGYIGKLVAKKLSGFNLNILVYDPYVADNIVLSHNACKVSKEELFINSDFISVHARLTADTEGFIGENEFRLMKPTAIFINTARAGLVDEDALYNALKEQRIAGAAMDVFSEEPLPENSRWLKLDNVTLTPHIAGTTYNALNSSPLMLVRDINRLLKGETPNFLINSEVLENLKVQEWLISLR